MNIIFKDIEHSFAFRIKLTILISEISHNAMGTGTPCVEEHVLNRFLFVIVVVVLLERCFRVVSRVIP